MKQHSNLGVSFDTDGLLSNSCCFLLTFELKASFFFFPHVKIFIVLFFECVLPQDFYENVHVLNQSVSIWWTRNSPVCTWLHTGHGINQNTLPFGVPACQETVISLKPLSVWFFKNKAFLLPTDMALGVYLNSLLKEMWLQENKKITLWSETKCKVNVDNRSFKVH